MKVLSKILWAVDLANKHSVSIEKIRMITQQFGNEIILLHVLPSHIKGGAGQKKIEKSVRFEIRNKIANQLKLTDNCNIKIRIEFGNIANRINKVAIEENVNIVLINNGKTNKPGENGLNIIRKLQKPVALISENEPKSTNHIVCPVNNTKASAVALKSAILHARKMDARLSIISVYEPLEFSSPRLMKLGIDAEKENKYHFLNFKKAFKDFLKDFDFSNIEAQALMLEGTPDAEIIKFCEDATVLYVGSGGKSAIQRVFQGSVSEKVIQNVNCDVVSVKTDEVFKLRIPAGLENIDKHFSRGHELRKLGYMHEAIEQYKAGLMLNDLHLPSILALAEVYAQINKKHQSDYYKALSQIINNKMMQRKIEAEIRRNYRTVS